MEKYHKLYSMGYNLSNKINSIYHSKQNKYFICRKIRIPKGVDQLIEVVNALKYNSKFYFHIVGNGSMKEKVHKALGALTNVSFMIRFLD